MSSLVPRKEARKEARLCLVRHCHAHQRHYYLEQITLFLTLGVSFAKPDMQSESETIIHVTFDPS